MNPPPSAFGPSEIHCLGVVVHPTRPIDGPMNDLRRWSAEHDAEVVQIDVPAGQREVAERGRPEDCEMVVSIGGDGTMLAATRAAAAADRPVLGVACGSLGALTSVPADGVPRALDRFERGEWVPRSLPSLDVRRSGGEGFWALNDIAVIRAGQGQIRVTAKVDEAVFGRFAGDGCIVSTAVGSSAYTLAAGGPLLAPGADAFVLTPLTVHGGFCPPVVIGASSRLELDISVGHSGARVEVDGQLTEIEPGLFSIGLRSEFATLVTFEDQESPLTGLRRRQIIIDSARILADERGS